MAPDSGDTSNHGDNGATGLMTDDELTAWLLGENYLESLDGLSPYERAMRLRDSDDREELRW